MKGSVETQLRDQRAGFSKERSCTRQNATLRIIAGQPNGTRYYASTSLIMNPGEKRKTGRPENTLRWEREADIKRVVVGNNWDGEPKIELVGES
ncbi:unnamed protein product [Schistosoma curassoni]|uniref:Transposase n=1 Tax=Schistosoma curassoni TaxID=6186 RepID=A0A183K9Z1_9TREM|nr:unnamed protein product [Schistosoma curassoni]